MNGAIWYQGCNKFVVIASLGRSLENQVIYNFAETDYTDAIVEIVSSLKI